MFCFCVNKFILTDLSSTLTIYYRFNLGFGSLEDVRQNCHAVVHQLIAPSMDNPPDGFSPMSDVLLDGVHFIVPAVDPPAFTNYTKRVLGLRTSEKGLSSYSRFIFNLMVS